MYRFSTTAPSKNQFTDRGLFVRIMLNNSAFCSCFIENSKKKKKSKTQIYLVLYLLFHCLLAILKTHSLYLSIVQHIYRFFFLLSVFPHDSCKVLHRPNLSDGL